MSIADFIDQNPIKDFIGTYPPIDDKFQYNIFRKKEFKDLKLPPEEPEPIINGNFRYQEIIRRFFSPETEYDSQLLIHGLGTGKTKTSILVAETNRFIQEDHKASKTDPYRSLVLAKGELFVRNYQEDLAKHYDMYRPKDDWGELINPIKEPVRFANALTRLTQPYYEFNRFEKFTIFLNKLRDSIKKENPNATKQEINILFANRIAATYSNRVIIVDEAHNLRPQPKKSKTKQLKQTKPTIEIKEYEMLHFFFHAVKNCKILLLTGTPIWDKPVEAATIMNLILPLDQQIDTKNFEEEYFDDEDNIKNTEKLEKYFNGRISFVRAMQSDVKKVYEISDVPPPTKHLRIYLDEMSDFQWKGVKKAMKEDSSKGEGAGLRFNESEASNFVFPNGSYGTEGFEKYTVGLQKNDESPTGESKKERFKSWKFRNAKDKEDIKNNLSKYSSKFSSALKNILDNPNELVFTFFKYLRGCNAALFGLVLELFGFKRALNNSAMKTAQKRYAIISEETTTKAETATILNMFRDPRNKNGDFIQVLIGTQKMSEGITLKNVLQNHVMSSHWNLSLPDQVVGRTLRFGAHKDLGLGLIVKIFLHAASKKDKDTIDIDRYLTAEDKDYKNKQIYRVFKKIAFDCPLTYERNVTVLDEDGSRECDYMECNYVCSQMPPVGKRNGIYFYDVDGENIDTTTYHLYYDTQDVNNTIEFLKVLFKLFSALTLNEIKSYIKTTDTVILKALEFIISNRAVIRDKYDLPAFLKEKNDIYFLDRNVFSRRTAVRGSYYINHPIVKDRTSMADVTDRERIRKEKKNLKELCTAPLEEIPDILTRMDYKIRILVLEAAYEVIMKKKSNRAQTIINNLKKFLYTVSNKDAVEYSFQRFLEALKKSSSVKDRLIELKKVVSTFINLPEEFIKLDELLTKKRKDANEDILKLLKNIKKKTLKVADENDKVIIHTLFSLEPSSTSYKRVVKVTGLMRCYSETGWHFCSPNLEPDYVRQLSEEEKKIETTAFKDNPYGVYGTVDTMAGNVFRIVEKKKRGFICSQTSNKAHLVDLIMQIRNKEREIKGKTSLTPPLGDAVTEMDRKQLIAHIKSTKLNISDIAENLDDLTTKDLRVLSVLIDMNVRGDLCPMIERWLTENNLIQEK